MLRHEQGLKGAYFDEVEQREGRDKWKFVRDFNRLVSGESNIVAAMGAVQKNLVDGWTEQDNVDMEVSKEEVLAELEYKDVLEPLASQYDDIEMRKQKSRDKIIEAWEEDWEVSIDEMMPPSEFNNWLSATVTLSCSRINSEINKRSSSFGNRRRKEHYLLITNKIGRAHV